MTLDEYASCRVPTSDLSSEDLHRLRSLKSVGVVEKQGHYVLTARTVTGVMELSRIRLVLRPKFPIAGNRLIDWLSYANGQNGTVDEELRNWSLGKDGYAALVPAALLYECRLLLRRGLRRDYVRRQRVDTALRGRLNVEAQATRCFGAVDRLHVRTFEYEDGGWENLVCGAALATAAGRVSSPLLKHQLASTAMDFPNSPRLADALSLLARAQYSAPNAHYRPAHAWARMVLGGGGPNDLLDPYGFGAQGLLLKLDGLWESVVQRMAAEAAAAVGGRLAEDETDRIRTHGRHGSGTPYFRPDVLLSFAPPGASSATYLAVDAKYKNYAKRNVSREDRHQLLTYIAGYTDPANPLALVVHPDPQGPSSHRLEFQGPRGLVGRILVLGLDTRSDPRTAAEPLRTEIAAFAASAATGRPPT
ncbi:5-methylcytosine restriction system specificity protein McrC [Actinacidiphila reveromycinica]|uniref:5-methylcytosine restriction system specificity protein McrC n=1 Tax=Actinacidiphila reveromycinica TaxID=659352 RepID=UPI0019224A78|nr:PE-PGRS family protein [Streptomyces sp. SN-593]